MPAVETMKILNPIIPFDLIFDIDYGILQLIKEKYRDKSVFKLGIIDADSKDIVYELINRKNKNPLSICIQKTELDNINDLYKDFINKEYASIINKSIKTGLFTALSLFINSNGAINPHILCTRQEEIDHIKKNESIKSCSIIFNENGYNKLDVSAYDPIYVKDYFDALYCKEMHCKNIYVSNYKFNLDIDDDNMYIPLKNISMLLLDNNVSTIISVYNITDEYKAIG